jgi:hypothetical protein
MIVFLASVLLTGFCLSVIVSSMKAGADTETLVSVIPQRSIVGISKFTINLTVTDVAGLACWQAQLRFNKTVLNVTRAWLPTNHVFSYAGSAIMWPEPVLNNDLGYVWVGCTIFPPDVQPTFSGSGILCQIEFQAKCLGTSFLNFYGAPYSETALLDINAELMPFQAVNGSVDVGIVHDVAVADVTPSSDFVIRGSIVNVNVSVTNEGSFAETFDLTAYANTTSLGTHTIHLPSGSSTSTLFSWDTSSYLGSYEIWAQTSVVANETDTEDNVKHDGIVQVRLGIHDIAVMSVEVSKDTAVPGELLWVSVGVANCGDGPESFWVSTYADAETTSIGDELVIGTQTTSLAASHSATLFFSWYIVDVVPGNLTVSAKVQVLEGETNTTNNLRVDGIVQIIPYVDDVALVDLRSLTEAAYVDDPVQIEVDVRNQGNIMESINITAYADADATVIGDEIAIGSKIVLIERFGLSTVNFLWSTTDVAEGNYTLSACASPVPGEVDLADNNMTDGIVRIFQIMPCPNVTVTCPVSLTVNPWSFDWSWDFHARLANIGNVTITSTGFEGYLRVVGSRNGTVILCVNEPGVIVYPFYLPQNGTAQVPLWLMFQPEEHWGYYRGTYTLNLTVCGTHRKQLTIQNIDILVCQNSAYMVYNQTASFSWNLTGGSVVYLTAETDLPPGWTYAVDPPIGTYFETPHSVRVNITAPPDAKEGEMARVTLRAYKNSTGVMIWQFIYFASTENKPPTIEQFETPTMTPDGYLLFNATARDGSGIADVSLYYSIDGGPWQNKTMLWASGDTFNSTRYSLEEYVDTEPKTLSYYLSATDWFGNQTLTETRTISIMSDVAVSRVAANETYVVPGTNFTLSVKVQNQGTLPLSFINVAVYANSTLLTTQSIASLSNGTETTLNLSLSLPYGRYVLTVYAAQLPNEAMVTNNADNTMITVALIGDINVDRKVDLKDVYAVGRAYGATPGHTRWNVVCDINGDGKIDLKDYYTTCKNYGKSW